MDYSGFNSGRVVSNRHWNKNLYSLSVEAPIRPFKAGQFTKLALPVDGELVARPYSLVNPPEDALLEFYSIVIPEGPLSPRLAALSAGDTVWVSQGANGFLVLDEVPDASHLWLLATGTGIGPFLSIIRTGQAWQRFEKIILVHAVRYADELTYGNLLSTTQSKHGTRFVMVPFVSREKVAGALSGRIPQAISQGQLEERAQSEISARQSQVMLCGNPAMVKETTALLCEQKGLSKNRRRTPGHITVENYW